jgi:hypothetical protein
VLKEQKKTSMVDANRSNIIFAVFVITVAILGGIIVIGGHNIHERIEWIQRRVSVLRDLPEVVALPDASPPTCERRTKTTLADDSTYVDVHQKEDGSLCESACLKPVPTPVCLSGKCVGECAGESNNATTCPVLKLSNAVGAPGMFGPNMTAFKTSWDGKCLYFLTNPQGPYLPYFLGMILHYSDTDSLQDERLSRACLDFIDDTEPAKSCLHPTFLETNNLLGSSGNYSMCMFTFECSRFSAYAGIGNGTYTVGSTLNRNSQPILTVERINTVITASQQQTVGATSTGRRPNVGFRPL